MGLPVIDSNHFDWTTQKASIAFFHVNQEGAIAKWGEARSGNQSGLTCSSSCVDWYGNTRPLFLKGRVYALMGSEVSEFDVSNGEVVQLGQRVLLAE